LGFIFYLGEGGGGGGKGSPVRKEKGRKGGKKWVVLEQDLGR